MNQQTKYLQILCNQLGVRDQNGNYLTEDGILGPSSTYAIRHLPLLKKGTTGSKEKIAITHIQNVLKVTADGIFGQGTHNAVVAFQRSKGLSQDGIVGPDTWIAFANNTSDSGSSSTSDNMNDNAKYIYSFFKNKGWTKQSICAMLGNMQGESGIIADMTEKGGGGGYGLVQWTPKSNLTNWANQNGLNYKTVDTQCRRIQWELENNQQFYKTSSYPLTFREFTKSIKSPTYLAKVFINNYERPATPNQPQRGVWAEEWFKKL